MRRISLALKGVLPSLLAVSVLVLMTTFAGMAIFGMDAGMAMDHAGMSDMACVDHCVSALPISGPTTATVLPALLLVLVAFILSARPIAPEQPHRPSMRRLTDIGKGLLHQKMSVVILRN